jgi:hypothetical protein
VARRKQRELWPPPPRGSLYYQHLFYRTHFILPWTQPDLPPAPPRGPAIDVSNSGGDRYRTYCQQPPWVHHRHLQLRWWPLPDLPPATPRGPTIDVSNSGGGRYWTYRQHPPGGPPSMSPTLVVAAAGLAASTPQGARHRRLQIQWWPLPDLPTTPPRGPPSMSPTPVVASVGPAASNPQRARHRRLQLRWWLLSDLPTAPPRGPAIDVSLNLVPAARIFLPTPTRGPLR